jgi:hypothetical protein
MMTLILGGLVTWRLAHMLVKEQGPLSIFLRLRAYLATNQKRSGGLFDMVSCVACMSIYIAAVTALWPAGSVLGWIWYTLAFSTIATFLEQIYVTLKSK